MSVSGLQRLGYTSEDRSRICRDCWQLGFTALQNADWMQVHNLKSVQAIMWVVVRFPIDASAGTARTDTSPQHHRTLSGQHVAI